MVVIRSKSLDKASKEITERCLSVCVHVVIYMVAVCPFLCPLVSLYKRHSYITNRTNIKMQYRNDGFIINCTETSVTITDDIFI